MAMLSDRTRFFGFSLGALIFIGVLVTVIFVLIDHGTLNRVDRNVQSNKTALNALKTEMASLKAKNDVIFQNVATPTQQAELEAEVAEATQNDLDVPAEDLQEDEDILDDL